MKSDRKRRTERNLRVANVSSSAEEATDEELILIAAGKMRLPKEPVALEKLLKVPARNSKDRDVTLALLDEREDSQ